ncbi:MAG: 6-phosphogluconolactonase [Chlamydiae bacterium CG10_big_fil_rev_8_21_14_0_10_35_9]|nr:MAG: 6-phosphogluconolactonase [Chlamydiae bacterium CG10_big_fil_rev_8_21_14_0_10_35_9]
MIDSNCKGRIQSLDDRKNIVICGDKDKTIEFSVDHWVELSRQSIRDRGKFAVALSGGSTPKAIYQKLCTSPIKEKIQWKNVLLFFGDERSVAPTSAESNYHMAMEAGFKNVPLLKQNIFRMQAEKNIKKMAKDYEGLIKEEIDGIFDLVMLGMGDDGHTASLFPNTQALKEESALVIENEVPQKKTWRMTLTLPCINHARNIAFYVIGESKKEMVKKVLLPLPGSDTYPSQLIGTKETKALWILDDQAALLLKTSSK